MKARALLAAEILRVYVLVRFQLRRRSLPEVLETVRDFRVKENSSPGPARLGRAVELTLRPMPRDASCLVKSVVLVGMLARRSVPTSLVIGVRPGAQFAAHAWVELRDQPLIGGDPAEYQRLAEL